MYLLPTTQNMPILVLAEVLADNCEMECSNIIDPVCGMTMARDGTNSTERYQNICYFNRMKCRLQNFAFIEQISGDKCGIKVHEGRRVNDFSIPGAHQACNHSCPTYCIDTYDPVCAFIHYNKHKNNTKPDVRTMINHCHVDLLSCSLGVNVSIAGMRKCFKTQGLLFMSSVAAMKTLGFLNEGQRRSSLTLDSDAQAGLEEYKVPETFHDVGLRHASVKRSRPEKKELKEKRLGWIVIL